MTKAFEKQDVTEMTEKTAVTHAVVGEDHAGSRLDRFLTRQYPGLPRTRLYRIVRKGEVRVNGKRAEIDTRLVLGDSVRLPPVRATAAEPAQGEPGAASSAPAAPARSAPPLRLRQPRLHRPPRARRGPRRPLRFGAVCPIRSCRRSPVPSSMRMSACS